MIKWGTQKKAPRAIFSIKNKRRLFLAILNVVIAQQVFSQNVGINATGAAPSAWAMLDIAHSTKGLLIPRVSLLALNNASPIGAGMPVSMLVYNTATAGVAPNNVVPGYYYWDGTKWIAIAGDGSKNWGLSGNGGTVDGTHFLGTTDNVPLNFRVNNQKAGRVDATLRNTFLGYVSGNSNTIGTGNNVIGDSSLYNNIDGVENNAIGYKALIKNVSGSYNNAIGSNALMNSIGYHNCVVGNYAMFKNTIGGANCAFGSTSLYNNISGAYNVGIGFGAVSGNISGYYNIGIGASALNANNTGTCNIGIGRNSISTNTAGNYNIGIGEDALLFNKASYNTAIGYRTLLTVTTGTNNIGIGYNADVPIATNNNQIRMGNTSITYAGVQVAWTITSDKNWKSEITSSNLGLDFIKALRPVSYVRNNDESKKTEYGFIAQEVEALLNTSGASNNGIITKDDAGMLGMRYNDLIAPMVKAIQEQQDMIEELKLRNAALEKRLKALENR